MCFFALKHHYLKEKLYLCSIIGELFKVRMNLGQVFTKQRRGNASPIEYGKFRRIAAEICDGLDNNLHYVALRLKEIQQEYHLSMDEVEDLAWWEDSTQVFEELYWRAGDEIYEKFCHRIKDGEEAAYTSPCEYERTYNRSAFY